MAVLLLLLVLTSAGEANRYLEAQQAEAAGLYNQALALYDEAVGAEPDNQQVLVRAAGVLLKADRLEEGNELLTFLNEALTDQDEYLDFFNKASTKMERDRAASSAAWEGNVLPHPVPLCNATALTMIPCDTSAIQGIPLTTHRPPVLGNLLHYKTHAMQRLPFVSKQPEGISWQKLQILCNTSTFSISRTGSVTAWAGIDQSVTSLSLGDYLQARELDSHLYLFDQPLPQRCPAAVPEIREPGFVQDNLLAKTPSSMLWPSLFVGTHTVHAELHVDAWCSHFYMKMLQGRKRWTIFPYHESYLLRKNHASARYSLSRDDLLHSRDQVFLTPAVAKQHPWLSLLQPWQIVLEPGDVLFVPAGSPHIVENMDDETVAFSRNFVDETNLGCTLETLGETRQLHAPHQELYDMLAKLTKAADAHEEL